MGQSHSRGAPEHAGADERSVPAIGSLAPSGSPVERATSPELIDDIAEDTDGQLGSRKRQRSASLIQSTSGEQAHVEAPGSSSRQRRRVESPASASPTLAVPAPLVGMEVDLPPSSSRSSPAPAPVLSGVSRASTPAYTGEGTPPPHLDALHEERDRARRRILEALLAPETAAPLFSTAPTTTTNSDETSDAQTAQTDHPCSHLAEADATSTLRDQARSAVTPGSLPEATYSPPATTHPESLPPSSPLVPESNTTHPDTRAQPNQPNRRAPLHPSSLSGTSMIVQGALVARTIPNRRDASVHSSHSSQRAEVLPQQPSTRSSSSSSGSPAPQGSDATNMPNGDEPRAVTLEEQAVMLSRILGIAAAATAATLVNMPGAQQVDRTLLQSSLQPPFTPLGRAERSRVRSPSSASLSHGLGSGLRDRLAALTQRVRSASDNFGRSSSSARSSSASEATPAPQPPNQQEIISQLIDAANREAATRGSRVQTDSNSPNQSRGGDRPRTLSASLHLRHRRSRSESSSTTGNDTSGRSFISRFMRETLGQFISSGSRPRQFEPVADNSASPTAGSQPSAAAQENTPAGNSRQPDDVAGTLQQVRAGVLPDGVAGSFGSFLNHLLRDLMVAVQSIQPASAPLQQSTATSSDYFEEASEHPTTNGAEVLDADGDVDARSFQAQAAMLRPTARTGDNGGDDAEAQQRRQRDLSGGNLSFFRLFRFDPVAPSTLVPCIVVGVRSLDVTERLGEEMAGARAATEGGIANVTSHRQQTSRSTTIGTDPERSHSGASGTRSDAASLEDLPASRFLLFVSGGRYPADHPLLNSHPTTAGRDLMILMDLLGTMQAMQSKPPTVSQQEIDVSELQTIKGKQVADLVLQGKITENMAERCLVCLEDWQSEEECRLMACRHVFHTQCVDRWMTKSSNTCPMCRRQGVAKDGNRAGGETAESRATPQV